ncbi:hypothetical protein ACFORK_23945 [Paenibacillus sp. GCM10012306]
MALIYPIGKRKVAGYGFELYPEGIYDWSDDSLIQEIRLHWVIK